jgi:hypothetical protein
MIFGFFQLNDVDLDEKGWADHNKELWWDDLQEYVSLSKRGHALLRKLLVQLPEERPATAVAERS